MFFFVIPQMWSSTVCDKDIIERRQDINNLTKNVSKI